MACRRRAARCCSRCCARSTRRRRPERRSRYNRFIRTMLTVIAAAFVAGLVHVLTGPDHLAAVAPLAAADRGRGWFAGWTWGLGHASGVVTVAMLAVLLRDALP